MCIRGRITAFTGYRMPAWLSRPSATRAKRCAASCTDKTPLLHARGFSESSQLGRAPMHAVSSCQPTDVYYRREAEAELEVGSHRFPPETSHLQEIRARSLGPNGDRGQELCRNPRLKGRKHDFASSNTFR